MTRLNKGMLWLALLLGFTGGAGAFSLLGPFKDAANGFVDPWQDVGYDGRPQGLGYQLPGDIGGPMLPTEAYRWNVPVLTYAFDQSFIRYFGTNGVNAVEAAIAILNDLPKASAMTANLDEFALDTKGENGTAAALGLLDLKSYTLAFLLEEMGLANPERFVWGLRGRFVFGGPTTNYSVVQLNYDPVTIQPTPFVNGVRYNYQIFDDLGPVGGEWASAVEWYQLDPLYIPYSSVAGGLVTGDFQLGSEPSSFTSAFFGLNAGQYYTGLTRDDAGGLRFLLSTNNMVFESLLPTVLPRTAGVKGSPWSPILTTNALGTNTAAVSNLVTTIGTNFTNFVRTALRPGVDKINFQRVQLIGTNFIPITLRYTDRYINLTNGRVVKQSVERVVLAPDIIFDARDLGTVQDIPVRIRRSGTDSWTNNAALNSFLGPIGLGGPGTINPSIIISYGDMVPTWFNLFNGGGEADAFKFLWGSFDGTTTEPVVYPAYPHPLYPQFSLQYLKDVVLRRRSN